MMQFFQGDNSPKHTARSVQPWFEEHAYALQHLPCPVQSPLKECGQF